MLLRHCLLAQVPFCCKNRWFTRLFFLSIGHSKLYMSKGRLVAPCFVIQSKKIRKPPLHNELSHSPTPHTQFECIPSPVNISFQHIFSSVTSELWRLWRILEGLHLKEIGKVNITHQESPSLIYPHPLQPRNTRRHRFVIRGGAGQMGDRIAPSLHES